MNPVSSLPTLAVIAVLGLGLTACGGSGETATAPTSPSVESIGATPATTVPAAEGPKKSPRGNVIKALGEPGAITTEEGAPLVNFAVNSIFVDVPCTGQFATPAENGHFVVLDVTIETTPELGIVESSPTTFDMNPAMFKFVGANGTTFNGNLGSNGSYSCLPDEQMLPSSGIGPAEKVTGKVVLDVPETTGVLIYKSYLISGSGWEWNF